MPENVINIPAPRVPVIDMRTGFMAREWYQFFTDMFGRTGGFGGPDGDKGDIVVSSNGNVLTIDTGVVETANMGGDVTALAKTLLADETKADMIASLDLEAHDIPIEVVTITDWSGYVEPDDTGDAIDKLAARTKILESGLSGIDEASYLAVARWGVD